MERELELEREISRVIESATGRGEPDPATPFQRRALRRNMMNEGFMSPRDGYEAHHIVPGGGAMSGGRDASDAQAVLRRLNIDLDSVYNGVKLSPAFHHRLDNTKYYDFVNEQMVAARSQGQLLTFLRTMARRLQDADQKYQETGVMPKWSE